MFLPPAKNKTILTTVFYSLRIRSRIRKIPLKSLFKIFIGRLCIVTAGAIVINGTMDFFRGLGIIIMQELFGQNKSGNMRRRARNNSPVQPKQQRRINDNFTQSQHSPGDFHRNNAVRLTTTVAYYLGNQRPSVLENTPRNMPGNILVTCMKCLNTFIHNHAFLRVKKQANFSHIFFLFGILQRNTRPLGVIPITVHLEDHLHIFIQRYIAQSQALNFVNIGNHHKKRRDGRRKAVAHGMADIGNQRT